MARGVRVLYLALNDVRDPPLVDMRVLQEALGHFLERFVVHEARVVLKVEVCRAMLGGDLAHQLQVMPEELHAMQHREPAVDCIQRYADGRGVDEPLNAVGQAFDVDLVVGEDLVHVLVDDFVGYPSRPQLVPALHAPGGRSRFTLCGRDARGSQGCQCA